MKKLKVDLDRDSIKRKEALGAYSEKISPKQVSPYGRGLLEATPCTVKQTKTKGILRSTQGKDLQSASTCSGFSRRFQKKEVEVRGFDQSIGSGFDCSFEGRMTEGRGSREVHSAKTVKKDENSITTQKQDRKACRRVEFRNEDNESGISLQDTLIECCQQIKDLKQIAFESQKQISMLCQEVTKQKREGEEVRKHLGFDSDESIEKKSNFSSVKSCLSQSNLTSSSVSSQEECRNYWTEGKNRHVRTFSSVKEGSMSCRGKYSEAKKVSCFLKESEGRYCEESTKVSPRLRESCKEAGVQCDFVLDEIIDYDEEEVEKKEKELKDVKAELDTTKGQKNDMIITFQQMLSLLEASNNRDTQAYQEKMIETQNTFSEFYNAFNSKLQTINQSRSSNVRSSYKSDLNQESTGYTQRFSKRYNNC